MQLSNDPFCRLARLCLTALLVLAWSGMPAWAQFLPRGIPSKQAPPAGQPQPQPADQTSSADSQEKLNRAFAILQQSDSQIPESSYDPVGVAKELGGRPDDLFAWVRDNTRWVPYRGALRGPVGVLVDRTGNSLDRTLLLADLYGHTPTHYRFAHATLSADQAKALFEKLRIAPKPAPVSFDMHDATGPATTAAAQRLERLGEALTQRAAAQSAALSAAIGAQSKPADNDEASLAALSDHWWLQREQDNKWVDLDVTIPGAKIGDTICPPAETIPADKLSKDLWQSVRIAVVAERWEAGKLIPTTVLSRVVKPGAVAGQTIYLSHVPLQWPKDPPVGNTPDDAKAARELALKPTEWVPMLKLGIEAVNDGGIQTDGTIDPKPQLDSLARSGATVNKTAVSAIDALDSGPAKAPTATVAPKSVLTAEWIEYTIRGPGMPDQTVRREVFDLIGPAARAAGVINRPEIDELSRANAALAMRGHTEILALPCQLSPAFVHHTILRWLLSAKTDLLASLQAVQKPGGASGEAHSPPPYASALYGLAILRRSFSPSASEWFIAKPNVFTEHSFARLTADGGQVNITATDLVTDEVALEPWSKADPMKVRLDQGVLDTAAEGSFLPADTERTSVTNTLAAAAAQSSDWVVAKTPADLDRVKANPDDLARLKAEVAAGHVVVLPSAAIHIGSKDTIAWWTLDPATGTTLGIGERGWGGASAEYAALLDKITLWVLNHKTFCCIGLGVAAVANGLSSTLGLNELEGDALSVVQAALEAACVA